MTTNIQNFQDKLWMGEMFLPPVIASPFVSIVKSLLSIVQIIKGIACSIFCGLGTLIFLVSKSLRYKCFENTKINLTETFDGLKNLSFSLGNIATLGLLSFVLIKTGYA